MRDVPFFRAMAAAATAYAVATVGAAAADRSCEAIAKDISDSRENSQVDRLDALMAEARDGAKSGCDALAIICLGRSVALAYLAKAYDDASASEGGGGDEALLPALRRAKTFGDPWQLSAMLGDVEFSIATAGNTALYAQAASDFGSALDALNDNSGECYRYGEAPFPGPAQIAEIVTRADESDLLAASFQPSRVEGRCGGVFLQYIRGYERKSLALPIEFEFGAATFTGRGEQTAGALLACLQAQKFSSITLTGHTDETGAEAGDLALSARRLAALREFLVRGGFAGKIELAPVGSHEPFRADDVVGRGKAEVDRLNRRVELRDAK